MADIVAKEVRSRMMSGIRSKNTKPELLIRQALHRLGFRFRIHDNRLPGKPDIVLPRYRAAIFVHGCFWHGHDCSLFKRPSTRPDFWDEKIETNRRRDHAAEDALRDAGWRVGRVWECSLKGPKRRQMREVIRKCAEWLASGEASFDITECQSGPDAK